MKAPINIIAESMNDSVPSTHELYETGNLDGIRGLARFQDEQGGTYIDVNVGGRSPDFFAHIIKEVQAVTRKPLSIDTPDPELAAAALEVYDASAGTPILNSISPLRLSMFELYKIKPFRPILLISEQSEGGQARTADETYAAAQFLIAEARKYKIPNSDIFFDPGIAPLGTDSEGNLIRLLESLKRIRNDRDFQRVHASVGLSNFTVMLPVKRKDGSPVKDPLASAFLTHAIPLGLDYIIGSVKRNYELLRYNHPAMQCVDDCLKLHGYDSITRVRQFYKG